MRLRCGVAGVGYLGQHHARIYSNLEQCEFVGVYDLDVERAEKITKEYGGKVFKSLADLGSACDAVSVVTPTQTHHIVASELIQKDCHLLVEKPLCTCIKEAELMIKQAREKNKILQVGHIEHYNPVVSFLEQNVTQPRYMTAERLAPYSQRGADVGVVLDLMIHDIGIALQLIKSPIESIDAVGVKILSPTEDIANARIKFSNGCIANFNASRVSLKKLREIRIFQPERYLSLDFSAQKGHLIYKEQNCSIQNTNDLGNLIKKESIPLENKEPLYVELESFVNCVISSKKPKVGGELAMSALDVALQITEIIKSYEIA